MQLILYDLYFMWIEWKYVKLWNLHLCIGNKRLCLFPILVSFKINDSVKWLSAAVLDYPPAGCQSSRDYIEKYIRYIHTCMHIMYVRTYVMHIGDPCLGGLLCTTCQMLLFSMSAWRVSGWVGGRGRFKIGNNHTLCGAEHHIDCHFS